MEEQLAELRNKLAEAEARATAEQRRREEEQRRREAAEADAQQSRPKDLIGYLEACHSFSLTLEVVTDASLTTQGDTTVPAGRPFPQRIVPWDDFPTQQEKLWDTLSTSTRFNTQRIYPSAHQLEYVQKYLDPISSELGLRHYARETVENPVRTLIQEVYRDDQLRERLQLQGTMMFESHTNLPQLSETSIEEEMEQMSITEPNTSHRGDRATDRAKQGGKKSKQVSSGGAARKRAGTADQFCIYQLSDGQRVPVVSIEYKPPHKLPLTQIIAGLKGEIRPAEEVINKEGNDFDFLSKSLVAAVITQLFSYMIQKGIQWGYVFVGEAIIFLHIPDDPTTVLYHLSIPRLDFQDDDENRFHRTSVAQIFAFFLNSLSTEAPSQVWHDTAATLDTWAVEYIDILKKIPETKRKEPREISYKAAHWKGFFRSPIRTRSRRAAACKKPVDDQVLESGSESDDSDTPPTPTPKPSAAGRRRERGQLAAGRQGVRKSQEQKDESRPIEKKAASIARIEDRPFCTQQCLLGLAYGGDLDDRCPNLRYHRERHISLNTFLSLIRTQLASDRGRGADCKPLHMKGSRGALFKVRLSSHGYTLVAKGMEKVKRKYLVHESKVYDHLRSIQGSRIPVSLGILNLELPYYYDAGIYFSMLLLSWGGRSLHQCLSPQNEACILNQVNRTLRELHGQQVLHKDVEPRNWLWDEQQGRLMLVDFERAEIRSRPPLGTLSPNRKRTLQGNLKFEVKEDEFYCELQNARGSISRCIK
jgi:tRNA A-37 threonylcarbamoyl transferase component Bud32